MNYGNMENSLNNDYNNNSNYNYSLEISKDNCYINNNPIKNYLSDNNSNYYNINAEKNDDFKKYKSKRNKICNLNNPKLIQAYNEGYYGVNNVPKQYYIYPRFANYKSKERNNEQFYEKQSANNNYYILKSIENNYEHKSKDSNNFITYNGNNNNIFKNSANDELSSYLNYPYPYPKLINLSSNLFGKFHSIDSKQNSKILNSNNNIINQNEENMEKEKKSQGINDMNNQTFNKKEDRNLSNKASEKVIVFSNNNKENFGKENNYQYDEIKNEEKRVYNYENYDLNDTGNFYYINNTITERSVPYKNIPDNNSIDDEAEDKI